jgi:zinc transporter
VLDTTQKAGLVCGYRVDSTGTMHELAWDDMAAALDSEDSVWLHFNEADAPARDWIATTRHIPEAGKKVLLGQDTHMRIDVCGNGLAGVVGDLHHEFVENTDQLSVLRLYIDNHCLISARRQPLQAVEKLRTTIGDGLRVDKPITIITCRNSHGSAASPRACDGTWCLSTMRSSASRRGYRTGLTRRTPRR